MTGLDIAHLRHALALEFPRIDHVRETGSTNADLLNDAAPLNRAVLFADVQTSARGRLGRSWSAPADAQLITSVILLPESVEHLGTLPLAAGLAVTDTVDGAVLKWPNDVLYDGKKLCGILAERAGDGRIVLGIGLNVSLTREQLPVSHATSLLLEGHSTDRTVVAESLLRNLSTRLDQWESQSPELLDDYRAVCSTLGQQVRLEAPGGDIVGRADGIGEDGSINVGGKFYYAGDITHLRPAEDT
ncbi:biotin--[acetyl-CoA-carboxylase] ligase [Corynebacterium camporealensis]|uniref:biotin--[acetyl-CoA-carboxylase] ligase n=1 Tax=Corynebacterium camporealensis TaxID=161896 RepID=UPI0034CF671A